MKTTPGSECFPSRYSAAPSGLGDDHHEGGVVIVTISREYGAAGARRGRRDRPGAGLPTCSPTTCPPRSRARLGTSQGGRLPPGPAPRLPSPSECSAVFEAGSPESIARSCRPRPIDPFDEDVRRELERSVREAAAALGDVVILGRMASVVLAGSPGMIRVFLTAPAGLAHRAASARRSASPPQRANAEIDRVDARRRNYARARFGVVWGSPDGYDLVVDTSRFGIEGAVSLIVAATVQQAL
jgi:cytidylate kinase